MKYVNSAFVSSEAQTTTADAVTLQPRRRLGTIAQTARAYPAFSQAALRDLVFKAEDRKNSRGERIKGNGLAPAVLRIGRKVLIDFDAFESWIDSHRQGQEAV